MSNYIEKLKSKVKKGNGVFVASTATIIGNVELGDQVSVWYGAVIRGDLDKITIGNRTNIQDNVVVHVDVGVPVIIGDEVVVGHSAIIHGAKIDSNTMIGMRATVLNHSQIGKNCIIGAHALVTEGMIIPDNSVVMGTPAKVVKQITEKQIEMLKANAESYVVNSERYREC